jgi:cytochrome c peroxidase
MHDGSVNNLDAVVEFYDAGGKDNPLLDSELRPLRLTPEEKRDLIAFLLSLSS